MNFSAMAAIFRKDLSSAVKNRMILIVILTPILLSQVFTASMSSTNEMTVPVALYDSQSNTEFQERISDYDTYEIITVDTPEKAEELFQNGDVIAVISLTDKISDKIQAGEQPDVDILVNPSGTLSVVFLQTYRDAIMNAMNVDYPANINLQTGLSDSGSEMNIPTWLLFASIFVGISVLPATLTTEKEKRTLNAILMTPVSRKEVIYAKSAFGLFLTLMISVIILYINNGFIGNIPSILLLIFLGSTAFTGLGLLIASYANNYSSASLMTTIAMMPLLLLALLADISKEMAVVSKFSPGTYMLEGIEKAMFNGAGIGDIGTELMVLVVFNVIVYAVTVRVIGNEKRS